MIQPTGFDLSRADLSRLAPEEQDELLRLLEEEQAYRSRRRFYGMFPDEGPLRRELYAKHVEFFAAGAAYRERCAMCANRIGKTYGMGAYEVTCHLTGDYPDWWPGRRFDHPVRAWAAGKTNETTRDIIQQTLLGEVTHGNRKDVDGTGMVPGDLLGDITWKQGVADLVDTIKVYHVPTGGWSTLGLKSYQQGRGSFEGTAQHVAWCDEEPPADVYGEILIRTATTGGIVLITFTPLLGLSEVVMQFMPGDQRPG